MYVEARQFKNAIPWNKIITIPRAPIVVENNKQELTEMQQTLIYIKLQQMYSKIVGISFEGEKYVIKIIPYIVNNSFACEIYLKILLKVKNEKKI